MFFSRDTGAQQPLARLYALGTVTVVHPAKQRFDDVYNCPSPERYFAAVSASSYCLPEQVRQVCAGLLVGASVVDLGAGYGANALLDRLGSWNWGTLVQALATGRALPLAPGRRWVGVDLAELALEWGAQAGAFDSVIVEDLSGPVSAELYGALAACDLVLATGAFGYLDPEAAVLDAIRSRCVFTLLGWEDSSLWVRRFTQRGWHARLVSVVCQRQGTPDELSSMRDAVHGRGDQYTSLLDAGWLPAEVWCVSPPQ